MKTAVFATLLASAAAFAPASQKAASSTALNAFEKEIGSQAPLGFWDPMGLVADGDQETFDRLRYTEVKHGRIAMIAVVGYLTCASGARFPGMLSSDVAFADVPNGFAAFNAMPKAGVAQILAFIFFMEVGVMKDLGGNDFPGDIRNGFDFGWDGQTDEWKTQKRAIELNNGRAAQMGIFGLMLHEQFGNLDAILPLK
eukprot:CAMPEP_0168734108 /NCGR_PEP_ID=MMETSP0724-20121128/8640_1 /TAXON_ID=265536 /ORGANISM="Amphiprora sp., Strain CCMP467" /LENGTH=197 /DNA_ID=CAMNT_0008781195 /DNA_START=13 /DNA_END=606 /DNA_ORIENTATION=+